MPVGWRRRQLDVHVRTHPNDFFELHHLLALGGTLQRIQHGLESPVAKDE